MTFDPNKVWYSERYNNTIKGNVTFIKFQAKRTNDKDFNPFLGHNHDTLPTTDKTLIY